MALDGGASFFLRFQRRGNRADITCALGAPKPDLDSKTTRLVRDFYADISNFGHRS